MPGIKVDGSDLVDVLKTGRAVSDYVRGTGPAILQIHTCAAGLVGGSLG